MRSRADSSFTVWAVLPPGLVDRFSERTLSEASHRLLSDKAFFSGVMGKADELEQVVFDGESSSWGPWPLWLDAEGLQYCGAIGLILGFRLKAFLKDNNLSNADHAKDIIESLIEDKALAGGKGGSWE
jgi:hypothetical protein